MKGQYLALESVLVITMGLAIAVGVISIFDTYQESIFSSAEGSQVSNIKYEVLDGVHQVSRADTAQHELDLPETVAGNDYSVEIDEKIRIITETETYSFETGYANLDISGSAEDSDATLIKTGNQIELRSG